MAATILVVEDEPAIQSLIEVNLRRAGHEVILAGDSETARRLVGASLPDLVLLDWMLPGQSGIDFARQLRRDARTRILPIIMLTARAEERDKVEGLDVGADDYITKPFSMRELLARVKAQLRRARLLHDEWEKLPRPAPTGPQDMLTFGNLLIDRSRREVRLNDQVLALKPKEYELLLFFAEHKGRLLSREFILERVWGWDYIGDSRTVDVHVRWLRQKIEANPSQPQRIITVRGGGYRFEG